MVYETNAINLIFFKFLFNILVLDFVIVAHFTIVFGIENRNYNDNNELFLDPPRLKQILEKLDSNSINYF